MAQLLKQSTAFTFRLGPFVDDTDGKTAETALTLTQADFRLSKAGAAFAQKNDTTSGAHDENGYYTCILNTTDTATLGTLDINVSESGALPVFKSFMVVPANVYDSLVGGTDLLDVNTSQFGNAAGTFASGRPEVNTTHAAGTAWASGAITAASIAADAIGASELAADAVTEIGTGVLTSLGYTTRTADSGTTSTMIDAALTEASSYWNGMVLFFTSGPNLGLARRITNFSASSDEITVDAAFPSAIAAGHNYLILPLTTQNLTSINNSNGAAVNLHQILVTDFATSYDNTNKMWAVKVSRLDEDEAVIDLDTNIRAATGQATANFDTITAAIKTKTDFLPSATAGAAGGVFIAGTNAATTVTTSFTTTFTGNLTGSVGSVTGAVGSVTGAVGSVTGSVGSVAAGGITAASFAANAITAAKLDPDVTTELQAGLATQTSVDGVAAAVWDALTENHEDADTFGRAIKTIIDDIGAVDGMLDIINDSVEAVPAAVWEESVFDHVTADTFGDSVADIKAVTDNLPNDINAILNEFQAFFYINDGTVGDTGNDTTHLHLPNLDHNSDGVNDHLIVFLDNSTNLRHARWIEDWDNSTHIATITPALPDDPEDDTDTYSIISIRRDVTGGSGASAADIADAVWDESIFDHGTANTYGQTVNSTYGSIGAVYTNLELIRNFLSIQTDVIGDTGNDTTHLHLPYLHDGVGEVLIVFGDVTTGQQFPRWITAWNNSTKLATIAPALPVTPENDTDTYTVLTIRRDTEDERFTFTVTGQVDANIESVNGTEVVGDGEPGTEWGPV